MTNRYLTKRGRNPISGGRVRTEKARCCLVTVREMGTMSSNLHSCAGLVWWSSRAPSYMELSAIRQELFRCSFLQMDRDEAEALRSARQLEEEKAQFSVGHRLSFLPQHHHLFFLFFKVGKTFVYMINNFGMQSFYDLVLKQLTML